MLSALIDLGARLEQASITRDRRDEWPLPRPASAADRDDERLFEVAAADESYEAAVWGGDEQAGQLLLADPLE